MWFFSKHSLLIFEQEVHFDTGHVLAGLSFLAFARGRIFG